MAIDLKLDRRVFLAGAGAAVLAPRAAAEPRSELFTATCRETSGSFAAIVCDAERGVVARVPLPDRGHDIAMRPGEKECVVFARRPGRFAVAFAPDGSRAPVSFEANPGRHFFGHGVFSTDGRVLVSTEDDIAAGRGVLGLRDATDGYRWIGEFSSGGVGPHDICLLADRRTLAVANGGVETGGGREALNLPSMEPSLAYVDLKTGDVLERHVLAPELHKLSIRHLAAAAEDTVVFGCQYEGQSGDFPPLVGFHRRGESIQLLEARDDVYRPLRNYVGSVAADRSGGLAVATSPRGGIALLIDVAGRRVIGERPLEDVCGVAGRHEGAGFLLTTGFGRLACWAPPTGDLELVGHETLSWDNHVTMVPPNP